LIFYQFSTDLHFYKIFPYIAKLIVHVVTGKLKHPQSLRQLKGRQLYYNNNTTQHSLFREEIIETERN